MVEKLNFGRTELNLLDFSIVVVTYVKIIPKFGNDQMNISD